MKDSQDALTRHLGNLVLLLICMSVAFRPIVPGFSVEIGSTYIVQITVFFAGALWVVRSAIGRRLPYRSIAAAVAALAFLLICTLWTACAARTLPALVTLIAWTSEIVLLLVLIQSADEGWRHTALCCLLASAAVTVCIGITQYLWGLDELRQTIAKNPEAIRRQLALDEEMWGAFMSRVGTDRAFGTFVYPNALAGFLDVVLPIALGLLAGALLRLKKPIGVGGLATSGALTAGVLVAAILICLWMTGSKGGWIAAAVALGFMAIAGTKSRRSRAAVIAGVALVIAALLVGGYLLESMPDPAHYASSFRVRIEYWDAAWRMNTDRSLVGGVGLRNFGDYYPAYKEPWYQEVKIAHSTVMQLLADTGIFGLAAYAALWWLLLKGTSGAGSGPESPPPVRRGVGLAAGAAVFVLLAFQDNLIPFTTQAEDTDVSQLLRLLRHALLWGVSFLALERTIVLGSPLVRLGCAAGCVAYLVHGMVDFDMLVPGIHQTAFVAAACACALPVRERALRPRPRWSLIAVSFAVTLALLAIVNGLTPLPDLLAGESYKQQARYYACRGDALGAIKSLEKSAAANPLDDEVHGRLSGRYWQMRMAGLAGRNGTATRVLAERAALTASRVNPRSSTHRMQLARIAAPVDIERAIGHAREAVALYPTNPRHRVALGDLLLRAGRQRAALAEYREALRLDGLVKEPWLRIPEEKRSAIATIFSTQPD